MKILITGASGLIGTALTAHLKTQNHEVGHLSRVRVEGKPFWDIAQGNVELSNFADADAIIHLAGVNIGDRRWSEERKSAILNSRINSTQLLCKIVNDMPQKPSLVISASAIGYYGLQDHQQLDESSQTNEGSFVAKVATQWEAESQAVLANGCRLVNIRTGVVLCRHGGALKKMLPAFSLGLGGVLGSGQQYFSWVSLEDVVHMIQFIIENESISGPINLTAPIPVTNRELTTALGKALNRPTFFPMPSFVAKILFGEMAEELLLSGARVYPQKLVDADYPFIHSSIDSALQQSK